MAVSAVGSSTSSLATAARALAAGRAAQAVSSSGLEGWYDPKDADQDGLVSPTEDFAYTLDRPDLAAAEAARAQAAYASQQAGAIQQAGAASVKAATGLDLVG